MGVKILAIETSCDETAICITEASGTPEAPSFTILGNALLSQAALHAQYGGVFPNLAKREHQHNLVPMLAEALRQAALPASAPILGKSDLPKILERETELLQPLSEFLESHGKPAIDCIAVTHGPGLEPALWVGINFAKALAYVWDLPLVPVNHMEGHIVAALASDERSKSIAPMSYTLEATSFPLISLLVSGGHTELLLVKALGEYELLGATRDDAAGECFDKCARLMGLPYPGGPEVSRLAAHARAHKLPPTFALPRPMIDTRDYEFSFSGLKTAVRRVLEHHLPALGKSDLPKLSDDERAALSREIEDAIVDVLVKKTLAAAKDKGAQTIIVGGGVSANTHLRERLTEAATDIGATVLFPPRELSTDNAVMIAMASYAYAHAGTFASAENIRAQGHLSL